MPDMSDKIKGIIIGTAVGDAIGLPREGLSKSRAMRLFGNRPLRHRLLFGKGMCSDDTEHTCMTAQSLISSGGDMAAFQKSLAWKFRLWLLGVPAGVGLATLKSICKLWLGFPPAKSGVYSAGNGPAMRSAILGLYAQQDIELLMRLVKTSTRITHTDQRAEQGALAVALAANYASSKTPDEIDTQELFDLLKQHITNSELREAINRVFTALENNLSSQAFADQTGLLNGVSGYIVHTIPAALFCWLKNKDSFRSAVEEVILLGGDTDTTGAITGALAGAASGVSSIPQDWINGLWEWPRSANWLAALSVRLNEAMSGTIMNQQVPLFWPGLIIRNAVFTAIVLFHGLRRLFPPY